MRNEIGSLADLFSDADWAQVFADENDGNVDKAISAVPPGSDLPTTEFGRTDVREILVAVNGDNDEADWVGVFLLNDGRYAVCSGGCDYTGWDCQAGNSMIVARTLDEILVFGLTPKEATRLGCFQEKMRAHVRLGCADFNDDWPTPKDIPGNGYEGIK